MVYLRNVYEQNRVSTRTISQNTTISNNQVIRNVVPYIHHIKIYFPSSTKYVQN
nr:MAG TPA: hypothetical protein [Caudoviricetes sp.]